MLKDQRLGIHRFITQKSSNKMEKSQDTWRQSHGVLKKAYVVSLIGIVHNRKAEQS